MEDWQAKLLQLGLGIVAWLIAVAIIVFVADRAPRNGPGEVPAGRSSSVPRSCLLLVGLVYPTVRTVILSFLGPCGSALRGLENYSWIFSQREILIVLRNTGIWVLLTPFFATAFGLVYALLIDKSKTESLQKIFVFMPMAISFVGAGIIWKFVYAARPPSLPQIGSAQPGRDLARRDAPSGRLAAECAVEHGVPDRRHDLDPGGLRDGGALRGDQGHPRRYRRGGPAGRRQPVADVLERHAADASVRRWSSST